MGCAPFPNISCNERVDLISPSDMHEAGKNREVRERNYEIEAARPELLAEDNLGRSQEQQNGESQFYFHSFDEETKDASDPLKRWWCNFAKVISGLVKNEKESGCTTVRQFSGDAVATIKEACNEAGADAETFIAEDTPVKHDVAPETAIEHMAAEETCAHRFAVDECSPDRDPAVSEDSNEPISPRVEDCVASVEGSRTYKAAEPSSPALLPPDTPLSPPSVFAPSSSVSFGFKDATAARPPGVIDTIILAPMISVISRTTSAFVDKARAVCVQFVAGEKGWTQFRPTTRRYASGLVKI